MTNRLSQDNDSPIFEFEVPISVAFRKLDVFGRGGDEGLWRLFFPQSSGWSTWTSISGGTAIEGEPAAVLIQIGSTFLGGVRYFHSFTKIRRLTDDSRWIQVEHSTIVSVEVFGSPQILSTTVLEA